MGWAGKSILSTSFSWAFSLLFLLGFLKKGPKKRSAHGLHGETRVLEIWAQNLPPAAAGVCLQLFMLQMDEVVVSAGQGRDSALSVQVANCSL